MNFFFQCGDKCGKYLVNQNTFESAITPTLKGKLDERIQGGMVVSAILKFDAGCPKCQPGVEHIARLQIENVPEE